MKKTVMILAGGLLCSSLATAADSPDLIAQAKKEGSVTFNVWYLQPQWRSFVKDFEQQFVDNAVISDDIDEQKRRHQTGD
ncbi:hypothetical protein QU862_11720, partial [Escherichia coli]|nr:hypothetical protein [Escherichia coli]